MSKLPHLQLVASASAKRIDLAAGEDIQKNCLDVVEPGDECYLGAGDYRQDAITTIHGTANEPITIRGDKDACIKGSLERHRVLQIAHDYYNIEDICFDGDHGGGRYANKGIFILGGDYKSEKNGVLSSVTGIKLLNLTIKV